MDVRDFISEKIGREIEGHEIRLDRDAGYTGGVCYIKTETFHELAQALGLKEVNLGAGGGIYFRKDLIENEKEKEWYFVTGGFDFELWYGENYKII